MSSQAYLLAEPSLRVGSGFSSNRECGSRVVVAFSTRSAKVVERAFSTSVAARSAGFGY